MIVEAVTRVSLAGLKNPRPHPGAPDTIRYHEERISSDVPEIEDAS